MAAATSLHKLQAHIEETRAGTHALDKCAQGDIVLLKRGEEAFVILVHADDGEMITGHRFADGKLTDEQFIRRKGDMDELQFVPDRRDARGLVLAHVELLRELPVPAAVIAEDEDLAEKVLGLDCLAHGDYVAFSKVVSTSRLACTLLMKAAGPGVRSGQLICFLNRKDIDALLAQSTALTADDRHMLIARKFAAISE